MAGWIAALDGLQPDRRYAVLTAIASRRDVFSLLTQAQTDFTPYLWRVLSRDPKVVPANIRAEALEELNRLHPGIKADAKRPEVELVALARKFYDHKARFIGTRRWNPDGTPTTVPIWVWDDKLMKINRLPEVPIGQAEEYYGLRYARWGSWSRSRTSRPRQEVMLALAAERAVERAKFGSLAAAEPGVYKLLADAPSGGLNDLLARGLAENRAPLILAMAQVLGDRADRDAATPPAGAGPRPSLLVRALSYPDHAVQFAAATALLRSPVPVPANVKPLIVDILRRASAADMGVSGESRGTVLMADPGKYRSDLNALLLRDVGFNVEQFGSGRDLLRRVAKASDFDFVMVDRHTATPELIDLIGQLQSDVKVAARPVFVIASADKPRPPTFDQLLVRVAALVAATENDVIAMPAPFTPDPKAPPGRAGGACGQPPRKPPDDVFRTAGGGPLPPGSVAASSTRCRRTLSRAAEAAAWTSASR